MLSPKMIIRTASLCALAILLVPAMASGGKKHKQKSHHHPAKFSARGGSASIRPVVGTWYVYQNGAESHAQRLALRPDGTFAFIGSGWKSGGNYSIDNNALVLQWTEVDGQPVNYGTMHKRIALNEDKNRFTIDRYNYRKHE